MTDLLRGFEDLKDQEEEYYPWSRQRRRESLTARRQREAVERRESKEEEPWDAHPKRIPFQGFEIEFFPIGALAKALGRRPVTIRSWIDKSWIPKARFKTPDIPGTRGNAGRRLWTRKQIEGIARVAREEGLLDPKPPLIQTTRFSERVFSEWKDWIS
jgi:hypothetical protein